MNDHEQSAGLTSKEAWWAGARAALKLPDDTPRKDVAERMRAPDHTGGELRDDDKNALNIFASMSWYSAGKGYEAVEAAYNHLKQRLNETAALSAPATAQGGLAQVADDWRRETSERLLGIMEKLEARGATVAALAQGGIVDDAMVERAEQAFWPAYLEAKGTHGKNCHDTGMRAALTAALAGKTVQLVEHAAPQDGEAGK